MPEMPEPWDTYTVELLAGSETSPRERCVAADRVGDLKSALVQSSTEGKDRGGRK